MSYFFTRMLFNAIKKHFFLLIIIYFGCCKPNKRCHNSLEIVNKSNNKIFLCKKMGKFNTNLYILDVFAELEKDETYKDSFRKSCIEKVFTETNPYSFYVVDPIKHTSEFMHEDSLVTKNKILKEYNLTGEEIKDRNFKIIYQ